MKRFAVALAVWAIGLAWVLTSVVSPDGPALAAVPAGAGAMANAAALSATIKVSTISTGLTHSCAVTSVGAVKCWGSNTYGELGNGHLTSSSFPVDVIGLGSGVVAVSAGGDYTCAVTSAGAVRCWGRNDFGGLGDGTTKQSAVPVDVVGLGSGVVAVSAGRSHTCAVTSAGGVKCWGNNNYGALGNGRLDGSAVPADVVGLSSGVLAVALDGSNSCAVTTGGAVKCWGANWWGQLGNGTIAPSAVPVDVVGLGSGAVAVATGHGHSCALSSAGALKCWGGGTDGELGNTTRINSSVPVDVFGLGSGVVAIEAGWSHSCAVITGGSVKCWGANSSGQLGDGTRAEFAFSVPVGVVGLGSGVVAVSGGGGHSCAVITGGSVKCWGDNSDGELGNSATTDSSVPVDVIWFGYTRIAGADRYATAVAISQYAFHLQYSGDQFAVTVASGTNFPDALAAGPVAAAQGGPLLLVPRDGALPSTVSTELTRLSPSRVEIAGGLAAVSRLVENQLKVFGAGKLFRWSGQNRYETAAQLAGITNGGLGKTVFIATGASFPDALGGSAAAGHLKGALMLTDPSALPAATQSALTSGKPARVIILGGEKSIHPAVLLQVKALLPGTPVERWAGADRYATAATISSRTYPQGATTAYLASGASYPDALAGAPVAALAGAPLLLTSRGCVPASTLAEIIRLGTTKIVVLGGTSAVSEAAANLTPCTG